MISWASRRRNGSRCTASSGAQGCGGAGTTAEGGAGAEAVLGVGRAPDGTAAAVAGGPATEPGCAVVRIAIAIATPPLSTIVSARTPMVHSRARPALSLLRVVRWLTSAP
jgi:hypothetical protein